MSLQLASLICTAGTAVTAFVAAVFWYRSSRSAPETTPQPIASISDNPELHLLGTQVDVSGIRSVLYEAARLNKTAAIWSAIAALLAAIAAALGFLQLLTAR